MLADRCYARAPGIVHVASAGGTVAVRVNTRALEFVRFVIVFTTFPEADFSAAEVLEWCWARWQVELVFKRFKTLAQRGHLPKYDDDSARAWLYGKLFMSRSPRSSTSFDLLTALPA